MYIYPINAHVSVRDMKKRIKGTKSVRIIPINARTSSVRDKKKREGKKKRIIKKPLLCRHSESSRMKALLNKRRFKHTTTKKSDDIHIALGSKGREKARCPAL